MGRVANFGVLEHRVQDRALDEGPFDSSVERKTTSTNRLRRSGHAFVMGMSRLRSFLGEWRREVSSVWPVCFRFSGRVAR